MLYVFLQNVVFRKLKKKNQLDATYSFIVLLIGLTCFGHYYADHQELTTSYSYSLKPPA